MLIYKQRYKPRTTREFTKSDLTVYDSAGNTALNALTVYGKSEVVDGAIVSAGEGWNVVRLADLTWTWYEAYPHKFAANIDNALYINGQTQFAVCSKYKNSLIIWGQMPDKHFNIGQPVIAAGRPAIAVHDTDYTTVSDFVASLGDATLAYQLADPTQGNCVAIKTDNGSGINGTMATFTTGTPLRGIPDSNVRDVMAWDGSSGEVTKNCNKARLADLTWQYYSQYNSFVTDSISDKSPVDRSDYSKGILCNKYPAYDAWWTENAKPNKTISCTANVGIAIKDTDYTNVTDFVASLGDAELVYELATPTTEQLTSTENASIAGLRTYEPQTHAQNNAQTEMTVDYTIRVPTI